MTESGVEEGEGEYAGDIPMKEDTPNSEALVGLTFWRQRKDSVYRISLESEPEAAPFPLSLVMCLIYHDFESCACPAGCSMFELAWRLKGGSRCGGATGNPSLPGPLPSALSS